MLEVLDCESKGSRAVLRILPTEGRGVGLCWAHAQPQAPKAPRQEWLPGTLDETLSPLEPQY